MAQQRIYPIGIQTFSEIREGGYVYVDKTAHVYRMTRPGMKYVFLSRPRRFGKSLLTSTLRAYFEGRKDLFNGLAIEQLEADWTEYPVLQFDMSQGQHLNKAGLEEYIFDILKDNEERLGIEGEGSMTNIRLKNLIQKAYRKTGKRVVVLIDEYDAPLLNVMNEAVNLPILRNTLQNFYRPLKAADPYIRFVFLTGITKFSQLSIFSALNNITNISMDKEFADICGITTEEMLTQLSPDIDLLAESLGKSREETIKALRRNYDGYHFTWPSPDIYNPYSLITAFAKKEIGSYWFESGTPTYLIEMLRRFGTLPSKLAPIDATKSDFDAPTETMTSMTPLLYQSGYITIKSCDSGVYTLGYPNREIETGLMQSLLPHYVGSSVGGGNLTALKMRNAINRGDMDGALRLLQDFLETIPYTDNASSEGHYQQVMVIIFRMLGLHAEVEVHTKLGRIDIELKTTDTVYIVEIKTNRNAVSALRQIDDKKYASRYGLTGKRVVKVGVNFDTAVRNLTDWEIE